MRVCGLLAVGVLLILNLPDQNEVGGTPLPDPCIIFGPPRARKVTTTLPPKTEQEIEAESKKEKVRIFETLLEEFLLGGAAPTKAEPEKRHSASPASLMDIDLNTLITAYIEFLRKFFGMF